MYICWIEQCRELGYPQLAYPASGFFFVLARTIKFVTCVRKNLRRSAQAPAFLGKSIYLLSKCSAAEKNLDFFTSNSMSSSLSLVSMKEIGFLWSSTYLGQGYHGFGHG